MLSLALTLATVLLALASALCFWRLLKGPDIVDRIMALDTLSIIAIALIVGYGIRTDNPDTLGVTILDAPSVHRDGIEATLSRVRAVVGDRTCYVTFDIDALDPAFAPGTGTPVSRATPRAKKPSSPRWTP